MIRAVPRDERLRPAWDLHRIWGFGVEPECGRSFGERRSVRAMSGERWRNVLIKSIILAGGEITLGKHNFRARVQHPTNTTAGIVTPKPYLITDLTSDRFLMCSKHMGRIYALGYSPSSLLSRAAVMERTSGRISCHGSRSGAFAPPCVVSHASLPDS